jgi:tyrosyl-tRNA synthetase
MFLAAKKLLSISNEHRSIDVLLADTHALSSGEDPELVRQRAENRRLELVAIGKLVGVSFNVFLASQVAKTSNYLRELARVRSWLALNRYSIDEYSTLGITDVLHFHREGKLKVGWSTSSVIRDGHGRHHEAETDLIAARIEPGIGACYVRHGVTLDSKRPTAVPYTELVSSKTRLMLTGVDGGGFSKKLSEPSVTKNRRGAVIEHLEIATKAFEELVMTLDGDVVTKAETIQRKLAELLHADGQRSGGPFPLFDRFPADQSVIQILKARGLVHQETDLIGLQEHLSEPRRVYCGFDPTASSLTIGNLVPLVILSHFQRAGHTPVVVLGGGTGLIGDPSGKSAERPLLSEDVIRSNVQAQSVIFDRLLDARFGCANPAILLNNSEWLSRLSLLGALRDIGKHISVNQLVQRDSIRDRMDREQGLSLTEFFYPVLQAWDFKVLLEEYGVSVQIGGADQWGNIIGGVDLVRRLNQQTVYGLTCPLITRADGGKFGKTEAGPIWLTADRTSPFHLFQFFVNTADSDVGRFLRMFTFLPLEEIDEIEREHSQDSGARAAQRVLAREVTSLIHGPKAAKDAQESADALFRGAVMDLPADQLVNVLSGAPMTHHSRSELAAHPISMVDLLPQLSVCDSKTQARQLLSSTAVSVNGRKASESDYLTEGDLLHSKFAIARRGRKNWFVGVWD